MIKLAGCSLGFFGGAVIGGAFGAAFGAAAGAAGAGILNAAGYAGYSVSNATAMAAAGNAVLTGGLTAVKSGASILINKKPEDKKDINFLAAVVSYVGNMTLGSLVGFGIFKAAGAASMALDTTAAATAVGAAVTAPAGAAFFVCCAGAALLAIVAASDNDLMLNTRPTAPTARV